MRRGREIGQNTPQSPSGAKRSNPAAARRPSHASFGPPEGADILVQRFWQESRPETCVMIRILTDLAPIRNPLRQRFHTVCLNCATGTGLPKPLGKLVQTFRGAWLHRSHSVVQAFKVGMVALECLTVP
jgi:hypothetical protein